MSGTKKKIERGMGQLKRKKEYRKEREREIDKQLETEEQKKKRGWKQRCRQFAKILSIEPTDTRKEVKVR